jgi:hypothetical protein
MKIYYSEFLQDYVFQGVLDDDPDGFYCIVDFGWCTFFEKRTFVIYQLENLELIAEIKD